MAGYLPFDELDLTTLYGKVFNHNLMTMPLLMDHGLAIDAQEQQFYWRLYTRYFRENIHT